MLVLECLAFSTIIFLVFSLPTSSSIFSGDKQALLAFLDSSAPAKPSLTWVRFTDPCDGWEGIVCNNSGDRRRIIGIHLSGADLAGPIEPNTLSLLNDLHTLNLSSNFLNGTIPLSFSNLTHLISLDLSNNAFSGDIPELELPNLIFLNLSGNSLEGSVPRSLRRFPAATFYGNGNLVIPGEFSAPASSPQIKPQIAKPEGLKKKKKIREAIVVGFVVGGCSLVLAALFSLLMLLFPRALSRDHEDGVAPAKRPHPPPSASKEQKRNRLVFLDGDGSGEAFDLEDLLRASAEVLGKGTFGVTYKAVLESDNDELTTEATETVTVVVKRLREVKVGRKDFEQQMAVVGKIKHDNVVGPRAYYFSKDERLLIYDYYSEGSLSSLLHGRRDEGSTRTPLDWNSRLRIALGAARGIARIHQESNGKLVHGNIKSTNIFQNRNNYGCVSDMAFPSASSVLHPALAATGYRPPELAFDAARLPSQASDVYSFGVLLLELLTGKSPVQVAGGGEDPPLHLVRWVRSVVREEWTAEVFDLELMRYPDIEEEMVEMLRVAMACVARSPEERPVITEVLKAIEDILKSSSYMTAMAAEYDRSGGEASPPSLQ